ncbi:uncharacterized protein [Drosophila tropicalis]|uniref:uncharacterized protein isoform X2 n=1 Tax=Drosophila tropicalis TaxID=46794 RepID=UPI0035ABA618
MIFISTLHTSLHRYIYIFLKSKMPYNSKKMQKSNSSQIHMYKNSNFVAQSNINITADGQHLVNGVNNIKERYLRAEPKLPNLEERAAMSSNKSLYKLSQQLAEVSEDENESKIYLDTEPEKHRKNEKFKLNQLCADVEDSDSCPAPDEPKRKYLRKRKSHRSSAEDSLTQDNVGDYIKEQVRLMTLKRLAEDENDWLCESPKKEEENLQILTARNRIPQANVSPRAKLTKKRFVDRGSNPISESEYSLQSLNFRLSNFPGKQLLRKIDAYYYIYTLIVHMFFIGYLIYILFVDVNEYLNEERRYLAKMETAFFPLKFVYFLLRLLSVRIF